VRITDEQVTSEDGVNATRTFFMHNRCRFQEIDARNDFGKDAYVDIATNGIVSYLCVALQIKAGRSYCMASGDYFIPIASHAESWRLLGGRLKTGHGRTLQNRPTEQNQNKTIYTLQEGAWANIFVRLSPEGLY